MTTSPQNSFLETIQQTEEKARMIITKGKEAIAHDLHASQSEVSAAELAKITALREEMQQKVQESQTGARKIYEDLLKEGEQKVSTLKKEAEADVAAGITAAQDHLIKTLLG
jgi:hypothetical protein